VIKETKAIGEILENRVLKENRVSKVFRVFKGYRVLRVIREREGIVEIKVSKVKKAIKGIKVIRAIKEILVFPVKMVQRVNEERRAKGEIQEIVENEVRRVIREKPETRGYYLYLTPWHMRM
jgi:cobalamin biosynthesis Co2+ chelatase CbiK